MPTLNYQQTSDIVEAFMTASGMRAYCTEVCKGMCCDNCYTSKRACHKHEGRRIACSVYMCYFTVKGRGKDLFGPFKAARKIIDNEAQRIFEKYVADYRNRYFNPPPKRMFKEFKIYGWQPSGLDYDEDVECIELVKKGLCLKYAARIKVVVNKITRLAQTLTKITQNPRLSRFDARRVRHNGRLKWEVKYWGKSTWL